MQCGRVTREGSVSPTPVILPDTPSYPMHIKLASYTRFRSATASNFEDARNRWSIAIVSVSLLPFQLTTTWRWRVSRLYIHESERRGNVEVNRG